MNRNLWLLVACQGLYLTNNVTFIAINGLVGLALAPAGWMATLPVMAYVVGGALATAAVARAQQRFGRKVSFQLGLAVALVSTLLCGKAVQAGVGVVVAGDESGETQQPELAADHRIAAQQGRNQRHGQAELERSLAAEALLGPGHRRRGQGTADDIGHDRQCGHPSGRRERQADQAVDGNEGDVVGEVQPLAGHQQPEVAVHAQSVRAASTASGAVSARSTRWPRLTGAKPCAKAADSSCVDNPPSGPSPRRQRLPATDRRAPQQPGTKDDLDLGVVKPYRHHRCTPMHQTALPCPPRHCGRAVALPQDVLTMASHTTDGNPTPMAPPEPPVASAHDGAIMLSVVGGQHLGSVTGVGEEISDI